MLKNANSHQVSFNAGPPKHIAQVRRPSTLPQLPIIVTNTSTAGSPDHYVGSLKCVSVCFPFAAKHNTDVVGL
jgi:hypothetical protein